MYGIMSIIEYVYWKRDKYFFSGARAKKPRSVTFTLPPSLPLSPPALSSFLPSRITLSTHLLAYIDIHCRQPRALSSIAWGHLNLA